MSKQAIIFVFTDWHLKNGAPVREVDDWTPFAGLPPSDCRTVRQIAEEINQRLDSILPGDFPPGEKISFSYLRVGPEVIESKAEPKWDKVWGAIVDRGSVKPGANSRKLQKMGQGFKDNNPSSRELGRRIVVVTPQKRANTLPELSYFLSCIEMRNAGDGDDLISQIAGWLAGVSQSVSPQVRAFIQERY